MLQQPRAELIINASFLFLCLMAYLLFLRTQHWPGNAGQPCFTVCASPPAVPPHPRCAPPLQHCDRMLRHERARGCMSTGTVLLTLPRCWSTVFTLSRSLQTHLHWHSCIIMHQCTSAWVPTWSNIAGGSVPPPPPSNLRCAPPLQRCTRMFRHECVRGCTSTC